jgi:hypothetical protein
MAELLTRIYNDLCANFHNYVYGFAALVLVLAIGVNTGQIPLPQQWHGVLLYVPTVIAVINMTLPKAGTTK